MSSRVKTPKFSKLKKRKRGCGFRKITSYKNTSRREMPRFWILVAGQGEPQFLFLKGDSK